MSPETFILYHVFQCTYFARIGILGILYGEEGRNCNAMGKQSIGDPDFKITGFRSGLGSVIKYCLVIYKAYERDLVITSETILIFGLAVVIADLLFPIAKLVLPILY